MRNIHIVTIDGNYAQWENDKHGLCLIPLLFIQEQDPIHKPAMYGTIGCGGKITEIQSPQTHLVTTFIPRPPTIERCVKVYESIPEHVRRKYYVMEPKFFEGEDNVMWWVKNKPGHDNY
jgi:hypothetical protein